MGCGASVQGGGESRSKAVCPPHVPGGGASGVDTHGEGMGGGQHGDTERKGVSFDQLGSGGLQIPKPGVRDVDSEAGGTGVAGNLNSGPSNTRFSSSSASPLRRGDWGSVRHSQEFGRIREGNASALAWPGQSANTKDAQDSQDEDISDELPEMESLSPPKAKNRANMLKSQKSYIPVDDLYVFQSALGDLPSTLSLDFVPNDEEAALLKKATELGLDLNNLDDVRQVLCSAVSLSLLIEFAAKVDDVAASTFAVVETVIKPSSATEKCPYAQLLDSEQVSRPHYFVCHSWGGNFNLLVSRLKAELREDDPESVFLWLDIFALNLHRKDRSAFKRVKDAISISKRGVIAVLESSALRASCCLYELWATLDQRGLQFLKIANGNPVLLHDWDKAVQEVDLFACKSTKQRDRGYILKEVNENPGVDTLNTAVKVLLTLRPPRVHDISLLLNRAYAPRVELRVVHQWLALPPRLGKTLWIRGPAGTGKSTVYAAIVHEFGQQEVVDAGFVDKPAVLSHAVAYNDTRTRIPMHIVHSLAYQLFNSFPEELGDAYSAFGPQGIDELSDVKDAVRELLELPIKDYLPSKRILIVLDGLDEGTGDASAGMANYDDQMLEDINLCWANPVLRFVCVYLRSLPKNVSLIVTSRSNDSGTARDYLEHMLYSFGNQSLTVEAVDVFWAAEEAATAVGGVSPSNSHSERSGPGGLVAHLSNRFKLNFTSSLRRSQVPSWSKSFPSMLYTRLAKEIEGADVGMVGKPIPRSIPEALKLCMQLQTKKHLSMNGTARLVRLLEVLAACRDPPSVGRLRSMGFKDVKRLVKAMGFMLQISPAGEVHAFHKLLFKFLSDRQQAGDLYSSPRSGHKSLARILAREIRDPTYETSKYALRYVLFHAHLADDHSAIDAMASNVFFWEQCFRAGIGLAVYQDLLRFTRMSEVIKDTVLFLSKHYLEFMEHPEMVFQRAYDTPVKSLFSMTLHEDGHQVPSRVLAKPDMWSAQLFTMQNPGGVVWSVDVSPDGVMLALGTGDHLVALFEAHSGIRLAALEGHSDAVMAVKYSCNGNQIASGSCDGTVRLWDSGSGVKIAVLRGHKNAVTSLCWSPDNKRVVSGGVDCAVRVWNVAAPETGVSGRVLLGHKNWVSDVRFSPDGCSVLSVGNDGRAVLWDADTAAIKSVVQCDEGGPIFSAAFSPDGATIATGSADGRIRCYDALTFNKTLTVKAHSQRVESLCYSANGEALASSSRSSGLRVYDVESMKVIARLEGHRGAVHSAAFSPDNTRLFSGSADKTCRAWGVCTSLALVDPLFLHERQEHHLGSVRSLAFGPDMSIVATGSEDCSVKVWDAVREVNTASASGHLGPVFCVDVSPDGVLVVSGSHDNTVRVWDARTGQVQGVFEGHEGRLYDVKFSPDGRTVASASYDMTVCLWDPVTLVERGRLEGHLGSVISVIFGADGSKTITASNDNTIVQWDLTSFGELKSIAGHEGVLTCLAASADGKTFCVGSSLGLVSLRDFETMDELSTLRPASEEKHRTEKQEGTARVEHDLDEVYATRAVGFSPDGRLVAAGLGDSSVRVYDVARGVEVAILRGHLGEVRTVAFSPEGDMLASGSDDMFVRLWDISEFL